MKDTLILQGKHYISSRRASEISDYACDYIGQLCRSGKLVCERVGRIWYVTPESLDAHKKKVAEEESSRLRILNIYGGKIAQSVEHVSDSATADSAISLNAPVVAPSIGRGSALSRRALFACSVTSLLALFIFISFSISGNGSRFSDGAGQVADAFSSAVSAFESFTIKSFAGVLAMLGRAPMLSMNAPSQLGVEASTGSSASGIAVVQSSGSVSADQTLKTKIVDTFSDTVTVNPDKTGTAGVITPVFKKTNGKDFLYVMVPVKDAKSP